MIIDGFFSPLLPSSPLQKNNNLLGLSCSVPTWTPETTYQNPPPNWRLADPIRIIVGSKTHCIQNFCWMEPKMRHRKYLPSHQWSPKAQELDVSGRSSNFCCLSASAPNLFFSAATWTFGSVWKAIYPWTFVFLTWVDLPMTCWLKNPEASTSSVSFVKPLSVHSVFESDRSASESKRCKC